MDRLLEQYFTHIGVLSTMVFVLYALLHYQLLFNNRDLIFWHNLLRGCFSELTRYKYAYTFITFIVAMNLLLIITALTRRGNTSTWLDEEKREDEMKERYRNFLFIRLLNAVDKIEKRYLTKTETATAGGGLSVGSVDIVGNGGGAADAGLRSLDIVDSSNGIPFENYVLARNEIWSAIVDFRKDAHKLFKLNETEIWLPIDDVFSLLEDEELEVQRTKYYKTKVEIDCTTLAALLYD